MESSVLFLFLFSFLRVAIPAIATDGRLEGSHARIPNLPRGVVFRARCYRVRDEEQLRKNEFVTRDITNEATFTRFVKPTLHTFEILSSLIHIGRDATRLCFIRIRNSRSEIRLDF